MRTLAVLLQPSQYISLRKLLPDVGLSRRWLCLVSSPAMWRNLPYSLVEISRHSQELVAVRLQTRHLMFDSCCQKSINLFQTAWCRIPGVCYLQVISAVLPTVIVPSCWTQNILSSGFSLSVGMRFWTYTLWLFVSWTFRLVHVLWKDWGLSPFIWWRCFTMVHTYVRGWVNMYSPNPL